jgi:N-acetylneuraminate synthase
MIMKSVFVIAEAGVNHNGSLDMALKLIDVASNAGADAVKFQTFKAEQVAVRHAPKTAYQRQAADGDESSFDMLKKLELSPSDHQILIDYCVKQNIQFLSTPFDLDSLRLLADEYGLSRLKIPSGEITNGPLLLAAARTQKPVILSTGMATLGEIEHALALLAFGYTRTHKHPDPDTLMAAYGSDQGQALLQTHVTLLHCTSEYPAPLEDVDLRAMDAIGQAFGLPVGLSDHTAGINIPIAAVARGAVIIEKHFTLDRELPGPDHKASLQPEELTAMVQAIRQVEIALGKGRKMPKPSERKNIAAVRRSLVAAKPIRKGEVFTADNITAKRPATGLSPMLFWEILGKKAQQDFAIDEIITL